MRVGYTRSEETATGAPINYGATLRPKRWRCDVSSLRLKSSDCGDQAPCWSRQRLARQSREAAEAKLRERSLRAATRGRIGLSIHPRYMTMSVGGAPFGEQLARLGVEPTLMIYVADANRVREIAEPLRTRWPELPRRVAMSLE